MESKKTVVVIDTKGNMESVDYVNSLSEKETLISCIMLNFYHCANFHDERMRSKVDSGIKLCGAHYVWAAPDMNVHYTIKVA